MKQLLLDCGGVSDSCGSSGREGVVEEITGSSEAGWYACHDGA
jgi:hypothetical protein